MRKPYFFHKTDRQFYDGLALLWGWNGTKNKNEGRNRLSALLAGGALPTHPLLGYNLGIAYLHDLLPAEDPQDCALRWFQESAQGFCFAAIRAQRQMYRDLLQDAQAGCAAAQYRLARYYHRKKRRKQRDLWLRKAKAQDYAPAKDFWNETTRRGGLHRAVKEDLQELIVTPLSRQMTGSFAALTAQYSDTLQQVTVLGEKFDLFSMGQSALREDVLSFYRDMEARVNADAAEKPQEMRRRHEAFLAQRFGAAWTNGQLHPETKHSLLSARVLLEYAEIQALSDCRGMVIAATSALERELKTRFYTGFRLYLAAQGVPFPENLERHFTLGSFYHIVSEFRTTRNNKNEKVQERKPEAELEQIDAYLATVLSDGLYREDTHLRRSDVLTKQGGDNAFSLRVLYVLMQYRNPAAHAEPMSLAAAQSCCDCVTEILAALMALTQKFQYE